MIVGSRYRNQYFTPQNIASGLRSGIQAYRDYKRSSAVANDLKNYIYGRSNSTKVSRGGAAPLRAKKLKKKVSRKKKGAIAKLKRSVKELKHDSDQSLGELTYRNISVSKVLSAENKRGSGCFSVFSVSSLEYILGLLKFFNPATPGTLTTSSGTSGSYQRDYLFKSITHKLLIRNNYQTDVNVKVYLCHNKDDASKNPLECWEDGVGDAGNAAVDDIFQYPTDCALYKALYTSKVVLNKVLSPGQSTQCSTTAKPFTYDSSVVDSHSQTWQKEYKPSHFLVTITGTIGHDISADQRTILASGVDVEQRVTAVVRYEAGINIKYVHLDTSLSNVSNSGVQSHQPIPDNIGYSIP
ncbi:hypothetical protein [Flavobacterium sp.]|uniref:hypothetical protein n=1 Tax=Flavobacterium sp. TaxID=239 RepID=UPI0040485596